MLLLFFMDGVKYDMMKTDMPFLSAMNSVPLQSEFGYSCACHATMYTSRYIEEHGTWFIWKKGDKSPYKWINYVPGLKYINVLPLKLLIAKVTYFFSKNTSYSGVPCLVNLPLKYWPLFELSDDVMWNDPAWKTDYPNLFTILKSEEIPHRVVALHRGTKSDDVFREAEEIDYRNDQVVYFFVGYTDNIMHQHGETRAESHHYLRKVDEFIKEVYSKAKLLNDDVTVVAFSDHGHIDIQEPKIDINVYFRKNGLNVNRYIHLIESNYARFWFRNKKECEEVEQVISKMEEDGLGFVFDSTLRGKYHLCLNPIEHGELVFYLAAPKEFAKTIWGFGHSVKSGHGYEPTLLKHKGFFASNHTLNTDCECATLLDVLPSVLSVIGITNDKYFCRGNNLLE